MKINTTCEEFVNKMKTTFDSMEKNLEKLQNEHNTLSKIIIDEAGKKKLFFIFFFFY